MKLFILEILFISLLCIQFRTIKNKINLAIIFTLYWFIMINLGILLFHNSYIFKYNSFYWILFQCAIFYLGYLIIVNKFSEYKYEKVVKITLDEKQNKIIIYIIILFLCIKFLGLISFLYANNINLIGLLNINTFSLNFQKLTNLRYGIIPMENPLLSSLGNFTFYSSIALYGFYYIDIKNNRIYLNSIFIIIIIMNIFITAAKSTLIYTILIFISMFFINIMFREVDLKKMLKKNYKKLLITLVILLLFFYFFIGLRSNFTVNQFDTLKLYGFGQIPAFDIYYETSIPPNLSYGLYTFNSIFSKLGISSFSEGIYGLVTFNGYETNIFTAFRSIIDDFGKIGGSLFFFTLGCIYGITESVILYKHSLVCKSISLGILGFITMFIMLSFLISVGNFFSVSISFFLFSLVYYLVNQDIIYWWKTKKKGTKL